MRCKGRSPARPASTRGDPRSSSPATLHQRTGPTLLVQAARMRSVRFGFTRCCDHGMAGVANQCRKCHAVLAARLIRLEWKGAETGCGSARLARWPSAVRSATFHGAFLMRFTVCARVGKLRLHNFAGADGRSAAGSASPGTTSVHPCRGRSHCAWPSGTASCIACAETPERRCLRQGALRRRPARNIRRANGHAITTDAPPSATRAR